MTAADIERNHDVEIINPDHVIAHLTAGGKIEMEIKVEKGRGYQPATVRVKPDGGRSIGNILLDASFSPVRRVSYAVESARVEQRTDLDKLVMDIETNGVDRARAGDPLRRVDPGRAAVGVRRPEGHRSAGRAALDRRRSIRSCCVRSTISS